MKRVQIQMELMRQAELLKILASFQKKLGRMVQPKTPAEHLRKQEAILVCLLGPKRMVEQQMKLVGHMKTRVQTLAHSKEPTTPGVLLKRQGPRPDCSRDLKTLVVLQMRRVEPLMKQVRQTKLEQRLDC
jgi:hypothetical protein